MAKTVTDIANKWKTGVSGAAGKWVAGIQGYAGNPMQMAAAQADKAVANYAAAKDRMVSKLNGTSTSFWKSQAAASQSNYSQGATKGLPAYTAKMTKFSASLWPGMKAASQAAGGGPQGGAAATQYAMDQKAAGNT